ncbi:Cytochrome P450 2U1 [Hypsibius exemplaris]|uniref:Cytochrome P450 2U1 n=1 Tax=Hypsibius exemplaris TaxID=2072580 RepID=A0A1W0X6P7_HYPEX|nr:Cytochrome P450 2U1 [Hypsibius exemplaris]
MDWLSVLPALVALAVAFYLWSRTSRPKNFPPGPQVVPFVGNILSLGRTPHLTIARWKAQYGDVLSVYDGRKPMVILSDFHTVKKVFADEAVTGRDDQSSIVIDASTQKDYGLVFSQGELWKVHRRFALSTLRDLGMGKNWMEDAIVYEVEEICRFLKQTNQKPTNPKVQLTNSISNVICALIFGRRFSLTDPKFSRLTSLIVESLEGFGWDSAAQAFPILLWFPNPVRRRILKARANIRTMTAFFQEQVDDHAGVDKQEGVQDYLFAYQAEKEKQEGTNQSKKSLFDDPQLLASLSDLFGAGTETTSTTTLWAFIFMVENPEVMRKVQEEIDGAVGRDKVLRNSDRALLPYTEAVILEVQRCASLVPLGIPHRTNQDITVDGYTLPRGTLVIANLFSIHNDPRYWKNPEQFDPMRFLDADRKLIRPDGFAPFSIGKRACLGEALAKMELFLFIANLLRCFTLKVPPGHIVSRENYATSIVLSPTPFELIFVPRT